MLAVVTACLAATAVASRPDFAALAHAFAGEVPPLGDVTAHLAARPGSQLLAPGATSVANLTVLTAANASAVPLQPIATTCRFAVGDASAGVPFAGMTPFTSRGGTDADTVHETAVEGLSSSGLNHVAVRCEQWPEEVMLLAFRALSSSAVSPTTGESAAPYPRLGNLWGSYNYRGPGGVPVWEEAKRIGLWLGAQWTPDEMDHLRELNPSVLALSSINAVEFPDGFPEYFYLHNISGQGKADRCEVWPGSYRLDLTNPDVARFKAATARQLVLRGGWEGHPVDGTNASLPFDGIFTDNVFLTQSWLTSCLDGRPFYPDPLGTGKPMNKTEFDAKWRAGVLLEMDTFRAAMPNAIMSGHAMSPTDPGIAAVYNAISIGFLSPEVIEGLRTFYDFWEDYTAWMSPPIGSLGPIRPHITMIESAIPLQLGYGYGFGNDVQKNMPPSTWEFSRTYYRYMRFGLAFTLLRDGYVTHEVGDSTHGQNWWYDEFGFDLGQPTGNATQIAHPFVDVDGSWSMWVQTPVATATLTWDDSNMPPPGNRSGNATSMVAISNVTGAATPDSVEFRVDTSNSFLVGQPYVLNFWAKSSVAGTADLILHRCEADWRNYGLQTTVSLSTEWELFSVPFTAEDSSQERGTSVICPRFAFLLATQPTWTVWVDTAGAEVANGSLPLVYRQYECGMAVVNGDAVAHDIPVPEAASFRRLNGSQAPKWQYIVDDASSAFHGDDKDWPTVEMDSGYSMQNPVSEEPNGPYYHVSCTQPCRVDNSHAFRLVR